MRVYIAGPITGVKNYTLNFLRAENKVRSRSEFKGCDVINPARLDNVFLEVHTKNIWNYVIP